MVETVLGRKLHKVRWAAGELVAGAVAGGLFSVGPGGGAPGRPTICPAAGNATPLCSGAVNTYSGSARIEKSGGFAF